MEPTVVAVSRPDDVTTARVVGALRRYPVRCVWLDVADFPLRIAVDARPGQRWQGTLRTDDGVVDLESVCAVYYRRPSTYRFPGDLSEQDRLFAAAQARNGFGGVISSLDCRWVNHPAAVCDASFKPAQLHAAALAGLTIPPTVITNSATTAAEFARTVGGPVVYKTFEPSPLSVDGHPAGIYTTLVEPKDLLDEEAIGLTACLFQAYVPKAFDVRITMIGAQCFGVAIHAGSHAARVDFRADYDSLNYQAMTVPNQVQAGLRRYLREFGLTFAAVDMVVTGEGEWLFLEANPNGQWGWIEEEANLPITDAFAAHLAEGA